MLWIKEVEMVDSVDDLKSSRSIIGTHGQDFEVLDAKIASALNRIIQNTRFKKKVSLEEMKAQKEDRFLRVDSTPHTSLFLCTMRVLNDVLHNTLAQVSARARFMSSTWPSMLCGCPFFDTLFLALFLSVCFFLSLLLPST